MFGLNWLKWWHILIASIFLIFTSSYDNLPFLNPIGGLGLLFSIGYGIYSFLGNRTLRKRQTLKEIVQKAENSLILDNKETVQLSSPASFMEERSVRSTYGGAVRVAKGVYVGSSKSSSHGQLKVIDKGVLFLTNKRIIFNGALKNIEFSLDKINSIKGNKDSIEISVKGRQKVSVFLLTEPNKWEKMIRDLIE